MSTVQCARCGAVVDGGILFCPSCQAPLPVAPSVEEVVDVSSSAQSKDDFQIRETLGKDETISSHPPVVSRFVKGHWIVPSIMLVIFTLLLTCGIAWWVRMDARSVFDEYVHALEKGNVRQAYSLSVPSEQKVLTIKPTKTMRVKRLVMSGNDSATVTYMVANKSYTRKIQARREGLSWKVSQGLSTPTQLTTIGKNFKIQNHTIKTTEEKQREEFITVQGITRGVRTYTHDTVVHLYPGEYTVNVPASSWYKEQKSTFRSGSAVKLITPEIRQTAVSRLFEAVKSSVNACMASSQVASECGFANPDIASLNPAPTTLHRSLTSSVDLYAVDFDSRTFTTGYISTDCTYSFEKDGAQVTRTIQLKDYAQGSWTINNQELAVFLN